MDCWVCCHLKGRETEDKLTKLTRTLQLIEENSESLLRLSFTHPSPAGVDL